jgi:hypothetical protein
MVWPDPSPEVRQQVMDFWAAEGAIHAPEVATQRSSELVVVARSSTGQIAGVSTIQARSVFRLGFDSFYYRTFVGRDHRRKNLAPRILQQAYRELDERFSLGLDNGVRGLVIEAESSIIAGPAGEASWAKRGMPGCVFIGWSQRGLQLRIWYFVEATIPPAATAPDNHQRRP